VELRGTVTHPQNFKIFKPNFFKLNRIIFMIHGSVTSEMATKIEPQGAIKGRCAVPPEGTNASARRD
jgi:hypothetical protein